MIVCPCGASNEDDSKFCHSCGEYVGDIEPERVTAAASPEAPATEPDDDVAVVVRSEEFDEIRAELERAEREAAQAKEQADAAARAQAEAEEQARVEAERREREARQRAEEVERAVREEAERRQAEEARDRERQEEEDRQRQARAREAEEAERQQIELEQARQEAERRAQRQAEDERRAQEKAREEAEAQRRAEDLFRAEQEARRAAEEKQRAAAEKQRLEAEAARRQEEAEQRLRQLVDKGARTTNEGGPAEEAGGTESPKRIVIMEAPTRKVRPGDKICTDCGEVNVGEHNFCRRCGFDLRLTGLVETPWWRKLLQRVRPQRQARRAGERPDPGATGRGGLFSRIKNRYQRIRRNIAWVRRGIAFLVAVVVVVGVAGPPTMRDPVRDAASAVWDPIRRVVSPSFEPVRPTGAVASSFRPGNEPLLAIDGISNRYWAEGAPGDGVGEVLTITFDEPTDIDRIGITPGASAAPEEFVALPRPRELHLVFTGPDHVSSADITLSDEAEFQDFDVNGDQVTSVEIEIISVYGSTTGDAMAIAEVEFFVKE